MDNDPEHTSKSTMDHLKRTQEDENPSKKNLKTVGCSKKHSRLKVLLRDCYVYLFTLYQRLQLLHKTCRPQKFSEDLDVSERVIRMSTELVWTPLSHGASRTICKSPWQQQRNWLWI